MSEFGARTIEHYLAAIAARGLRLNNLFQRHDDRWQANLRTAGAPDGALCFGWGLGRRPEEALASALFVSATEAGVPARQGAKGQLVATQSAEELGL